MYYFVDCWTLTCVIFLCPIEEYIDESGNPIWKNRVESWKDKKKRKKKDESKPVKEAQIPADQQMEEKGHE